MLVESVPPTGRFRLFSWPAVAVVLLLIQAALSVTVQKGGTLTAFSMITYFLVLVLAAGIATLNAVHNRKTIRLFWSFLAMAYGAWSLNALSWIYYVLGLGRNRPVYLFAAVPLFLHIVLMIAAVVSCPHLELSRQRGYRTTLNFLLLLFFWVFAYAFFWVPYSYTHWDAALILRGEALYLAENFFLLVVLGVLILRAQPPWKSIYWHLLGASVLYVLGSLAANIVLAFSGYYAGLKDIPYTAAACWFVWVALRGRKLAPQLALSVQPDTSDTEYASLLAMLSVVAIPVVGLWELFRAGERIETRVIRLLIVLLSVLFLAVFVFVKEYLANRELAADVGLATDQLRLAMESGKSVGWDWNLKSGRDIWFGDLQAMFGIPSNTYSGSVEDFYRYVHPEDRQQVSEAVKEARQGQKPYVGEFRIVWPDGTLRWAAARGKFHYAKDGDPERMLGVAVDITERRRAEEALRESEQRFRLVANAAPVMIWVSGPDKLCTYFNQTWLDFTGRPVEDELGNGWAEGVHPDDLQNCLGIYIRSFDRRSAFRMEYRLRRYDGEYRWILDIGVPRVNENGSFAGYIGSCIDVTERRAAEEALAGVSGRLIKAQEEERARIARELHDDINQQLALVTIAVDELKQNLPRSLAQLRSRMEELGNRTSEVSRSVQALSHRLHSSKLEYLGLVTATRGFCQEFSDQHQVEVRFAHEQVPHSLPLDTSLCLFRILQAALTNALKHSGVKYFEVQLNGGSEGIDLTVRDAGMGFNLEKVLSGHGIGIVSMRERVRLVNGSISIQSKPNSGTTIEVHVPLSTSKANVQGGSAA